MQMTKAPYEIIWSKGAGTLVTFCSVQATLLKNIAKTSMNSIWVQVGLCWLELALAMFSSKAANLTYVQIWNIA